MSRAIILPTDLASRSVSAVKSRLPNHCFYQNGDGYFSAKIYHPHRDRFSDLKITVDVSTRDFGNHECLLEVRITSEADDFVRAAYPKRNVERPNPLRFGRSSGYNSTSFEDPNALVELVLKIIEFKTEALRFASTHVPGRFVDGVVQKLVVKSNPDYESAWDEYEYARHRKGYIAEDPDEQGIPKNIGVRKNIKKRVWAAGTDTVGKIAHLNKGDLFEELSC